MHIDIHIPRPGLTLLVLAAVSGWGLVWMQWGSQPTVSGVVTAQTIGLSSSSVPAGVAQAALAAQVAPLADAAGSDASATDATDDTPLSPFEVQARQARTEQQLIQHKEDIIRYEISVLQQERQSLGSKVDPQLEDQFRQSTTMLAGLMQDEQKAQEFLLTSLDQMWEADNKAMQIGREAVGKVIQTAFDWPVSPLQGISAYFLDPSYEERFKMEHYAVDIPTPQGTVIKAAADGIVKDVVDHGLGFNYITIEHKSGYSTMYGHLSGFIAKKGQYVMKGDPIAYSGGRPGTPGAGFSTGPHLHFAVFLRGKPMDPMKVLPKM